MKSPRFRSVVRYIKNLIKDRPSAGTVTKNISALPVFKMSDYLALVVDLPVPSAAQQIAFCKFIATAHSWYKHLRLCPPGVPIYVFMDPSAGCDRIKRADGSYEVSERVESSPHSRALPTKEYRQHFGYLDYCEPPESGFEGRPSVLRPGTYPTIVDVKGHLCRLPYEIQTAGEAIITGVIHTCAVQPGIWTMERRVGQPRIWPEESGGSAVLEHILSRSGELIKDRSLEIPESGVRRESLRGRLSLPVALGLDTRQSFAA